MPTNDNQRQRRARGSLSAEEILVGARELVEQRGLHNLSMPILANHLKSGVASIYWYFKSKDDLLLALTDSVTREMYRSLPPLGNGPWDQEMVGYFLEFRKFIESNLIYREAFVYRGEILMTQSVMAPSLKRRLNVGLTTFKRGGFNDEQAAEGMSICASYTRGYVALRHSAKKTRTTNPFGPWLGLGDKQFEFGLRLILIGLATTYGVESTL